MGFRGHGGGNGDMGFRGHGSTGSYPNKQHTFRVRHGGMGFRGHGAGHGDMGFRGHGSIGSGLWRGGTPLRLDIWGQGVQGTWGEMGFRGHAGDMGTWGLGRWGDMG